MRRCRIAGLTRRPHGVVLLAFLLALALAGIGALAAFDVWSVTRQREREQQLLFVGHQYRNAIRAYYFGGPAEVVGADRVAVLVPDEQQLLFALPLPGHAPDIEGRQRTDPRESQRQQECQQHDAVRASRQSGNAAPPHCEDSLSGMSTGGGWTS